MEIHSKREFTHGERWSAHAGPKGKSLLLPAAGLGRASSARQGSCPLPPPPSGTHEHTPWTEDVQTKTPETHPTAGPTCSPGESAAPRQALSRVCVFSTPAPHQDTRSLQCSQTLPAPRCRAQASPTSQCGCTDIAVGIAVPFPVAGRGHGLPHVQLQLLGSTGLPSLQAPVRAPPGAAQLAGKGTQITHQPAGRQDGREAGSSEDQGRGEASLTLRASAGGEMSLSRWESRASPEAPPCSTPAEAPHTCTQSSRTAYTLVRTVLQGAQRAPVRGGHAAAPSPAAPAHHHPSSLFPSWTVTCRASPGLVRGSPSQCSRH